MIFGQNVKRLEYIPRRLPVAQSATLVSQIPRLTGVLSNTLQLTIRETVAGFVKFLQRLSEPAGSKYPRFGPVVIIRARIDHHPKGGGKRFRIVER